MRRDDFKIAPRAGRFITTLYMATTAKYATAFSLTLAPVLLFIPAVMLAGLGPCGFANPLVLVIAFLLFVALEIAALPQFVRAARAAGKAPLAIIGITMSVLLLVLSAVMEYYVAADYWVEMSFR